MNRARSAVVPALLAAATLLPGCPDAGAQPDATLGDAPNAADAPGDGFTADAVVDPSLELGSGQLYYQAVDALNGRVKLIHGPQGGYHLFARLRGEHLGPDVYVTFAVTPLSGGPSLNSPSERIHLREGFGLNRTASGWETSNALLCILTQVHSADAVLNRRFRWQVVVYPNGAGTVSTAQRLITVIDTDP